MTRSFLVAARFRLPLVAMFLFSSPCWSAPLRLGVASLAEPWRPGYHKIGSIEKGSPAEAVGLKAGYVIVAIDGKVVGDPRKIRREIKDKDQITIVYHDGSDLYEVTADLQRDDSYRYGGKVVGKPKRTKLKPPVKDKEK